MSNIVALLLSLSVAAQPTAATGLRTPGEIFQAVCLADEVKLAVSDFRMIDFRSLPDGAKAAMLRSLPPEIVGGFAKWSELGDGDVPNRLLLSLPKKKTYVVLPAPGEKGRMASQCAVVWRGNHYADALKIANSAFEGKDMSAPLSSSKGLPGMNSVSVTAEGRSVGAVEWNGWTIVRVAPDTSPGEQATQ